MKIMILWILKKRIRRRYEEYYFSFKIESCGVNITEDIKEEENGDYLTDYENIDSVNVYENINEIDIAEFKFEEPDVKFCYLSTYLFKF